MREFKHPIGDEFRPYCGNEDPEGSDKIYRLKKEMSTLIERAPSEYVARQIRKVYKTLFPSEDLEKI